MVNKKGSSLLEIRRKNRISIKDTIFYRELITRSDIAKELELSLPTITTSVNEMIQEGILEELPLPDFMLANTMGRRPLGISFHPQAAFAIGLELGPYTTTAVLVNMKGETIDSRISRPADKDYEIILVDLSKLIVELKEKNSHIDLLGVGIGIPGFIESDKGIIRSSYRQDWSGRCLAEDLEKTAGLPVIIDNNVRLRAAGYEMAYRRFRPDTFAYFYISRGIACPLMIKADILPGYSAGAGEIGHAIVSIRYGEGNEEQVPLEDLAGEEAIIRKCQEALKMGKAKILKGFLDEAEKLTMKTILKAQAGGDEDIIRIMAASIDYLGIALSNVVNLINPDIVVVDGYIMKLKENQVLLQQSARKHFFGLNEEEVKIVFQPFHQLHGAKGAALVAIRRLFLER